MSKFYFRMTTYKCILKKYNTWQKYNILVLNVYAIHVKILSGAFFWCARVHIKEGFKVLFTSLRVSYEID